MQLLMNNKNTNIAYGIAALGMLYALFVWDWSLFCLSLTIHILLISVFSAVTHRYFSHRAFQANPNFMWLLAALTVCYSYASPINWTYLHSAHHRYADTNKDPHVKGWRGLFTASYRLPDKKFLVSSRWFADQKHLWLHNHAVLFVAGFGLVSLAVSPDFFVWGFLLPVFFLHFGQGFHKSFSHSRWGATNHWWMEFVVPMGGEWIHHKHHDFPSEPRFRSRWYEFDPGWLLIKLIRQDRAHAKIST